MKQTI